MPRMLDLVCSECHLEMPDFFVMTVPDRIIHFRCGGEMTPIFTAPGSRPAAWRDQDAVVVFRKPDGTYSYPMTNTQRTPAGCERVVMKSLREVERFEQAAGVLNEAMHFDRNGRGFDDTFRGRPI